ncbi:hypothetical protein O181_066456 [Austropuccinia psidii MF-1]|uniref:Carboxymuconolactone decarboxylase-like domain-containing protein n=1 Tax=Austropuccinia psidii MF-1 TaxID=1389203 RepID=A0A9Q3EQZ2_9BASI|nr:hypothetical protein [Austropuccinia psidii MF-1]
MFPRKLSTPPTFGFLNRIRSTIKRPDLDYLLTSIASTSLGHGEAWLPVIFSHAIKRPLNLSLESQNLQNPLDQYKILVFRQMKEAIIKASILIGVPKAIEASLTLKETGSKFEVHEHTFTRKHFMDLTFQDLINKGDQGMSRVYKGDIDGIFKYMGPDLVDIQLMSRAITYGFFLSPVQPESPLTPQQVQAVILSALISQRAKREIVWHLRGALRHGFDRDEIESIQSAVELVSAQCTGEHNFSDGLARIKDIEEEPQEQAK